MKLVQLLAKELKEWPEDDEGSDPILFITQNASGAIFSWNDNGELKFVDGQWYMQGTIPFDDVIFDGSEICSDCSSAIVREDQWHYEREKMNKPKWIRHRGGKCPVPCGTKVETRHRDGYICTPHFYTQNASSDVGMNLVWSHKGDKMDIMAYRVIEETKDQEIEEVETIDTAKAPTIEYAFGDKDSDPKDLDWKQLGTLTYKLEIEATEATKEIDSLVAKWGQIESPLKWRDAIIHCQAIIEDCEREIERNVNLLDAEGLMMQKDSKKAMQHYQTDIEMSDWRNWKRGDIISISNDPDIKDGEYKVTSIEEYDYDGDLPVQVTYGWADFSEANVKFIRRP